MEDRLEAYRSGRGFFLCISSLRPEFGQIDVEGRFSREHFLSEKTLVTTLNSVWTVNFCELKERTSAEEKTYLFESQSSNDRSSTGIAKRELDVE